MAYQKTDWKDQQVENPRTYSVRQNLDNTITLLDAFGDITEIGTPVNAENMNKIEEQLYKNDLERKITNCITEIPQNIKLELNNGTLTLKAGSKVYVPNGFEADGVTPKLDVVTIDSDKVVGQAGTVTGAFALYRSDDGTCYSADSHRISSGATAPSSLSVTTTWYDTTNNAIKVYNGTNWVSDVAFPLCIFSNSNSLVTSIDQVFNGFGYIGSTVFALPGVKGLIPNGRNADGSLKNVEWTANKVITSTLTYGNQSYYFGVYNNNQELGFYGKTFTKYDEKSNTIIDTYPDPDVIRTGWSFFGECIGDSNNKITSFTPKTAFHAVDYNDFQLASNELSLKKNIAYEKVKFYTANGTLNIPLQDTDEIINVTINGNSTLNFDISQLNFPAQNFYTVQIKLLPGTFTVSLNVIGLQENAPIVWVNGNVADLSDHKSHWVVLRTYQNKGYALWSDAGAEG